MPKYSTVLLNQFAPHITELTECNIPELSDQYAKSIGWLHNYILQSTFTISYPEPYHKFAIAFFRKTESAFHEYYNGKTSLQEFIKTPILYSDDPHSLLRLYFKCLRHFELTVSLITESYLVFGRFLSDPVPKNQFWSKNDGSALDKINIVYNNIKHAEDRIRYALSEPGYHIWLTNNGISCEQGSISYLEISNILIELAENADYYCNPKNAFEDI